MLETIYLLYLNINIHGWTMCDISPVSNFQMFYDRQYIISII